MELNTTGSATVLVTRPQHQAQEFVAALEQAGLRAVVFPLIEIVPPVDPQAFEAALQQLHTYDVLLLTSVNAVNIVLQYLESSQIEIPPTLRFVCVGPATARRLERWGHSARIPHKDYTAEGVLELLSAEKMEHSRVLYPRAELARDVIVPGLEKLGAQVDAPVAYRTLATAGRGDALLHLLQTQIDCVTFTSPSAVRNYVEVLGPRIGAVPERMEYFTIGPVTSAAVRACGLSVAREAQPYTLPGLIAAVKSKVLDSEA